MGELRIHLLGRFRLVREGVEERIPRRIRELVAYFSLRPGRFHPRETLLELFWPGVPPDRARRSLRTALWRLRHALDGADGAPACLLEDRDGCVGLCQAGAYWLDVDAFRQTARRVLRRPFHAADDGDERAIEDAVGFYGGDFLEGHYADWVLQERERLRVLYLQALTWLMRRHGYYGQYDEALDDAQRLLAAEPLWEDAHREIVRIYLETGRRGLASRHLREHRAALGAEGLGGAGIGLLGLDGLPRDGASALEQDCCGDVPGGPEPEALQRLEKAVRRFDAARSELLRAVRLASTHRGPGRPRSPNG